MMVRVCTGVRLLPEELRKRQQAKERGAKAKQTGWNTGFSGPISKAEQDIKNVERDRIDRCQDARDRVLKNRMCGGTVGRR